MTDEPVGAAAADAAVLDDATVEAGAVPINELIPLAAIRRERPPVSPWVARRIDRLSRRAHRFHRFAHHPLCGRYAGEVIRLGRRTRLCRGCTFAIAGGVIGGAAGIAVGAAVAGAAAAISLTAIAAATLLLLPMIVSRRRIAKLISRALPAALFGLAITNGLVGRQPAFAAVAAAMVIGVRILYGRRGGDRSPCVSCPERTCEPCSGFAPIVRREQAFQRVVRRWLG